MLSPHRATNIMVSTDRLNSSSSTLGMARILHPIHPPVFIALQTANTVSQITKDGLQPIPHSPPCKQQTRRVNQFNIMVSIDGLNSSSNTRSMARILHPIHPPVFIALHTTR